MAQIWSDAGILAGINDFNPSQLNKTQRFMKIRAEKPKYRAVKSVTKAKDLDPLSSG